MTDAPQERAPLGHPAEPEVPHHTVSQEKADRPPAAGDVLEDSVAYELAVEDGIPLGATAEEPVRQASGPEFREPGGR